MAPDLFLLQHPCPVHPGPHAGRQHHLLVQGAVLGALLGHPLMQLLDAAKGVASRSELAQGLPRDPRGPPPLSASPHRHPTHSFSISSACGCLSRRALSTSRKRSFSNTSASFRLRPASCRCCRAWRCSLCCRSCRQGGRARCLSLPPEPHPRDPGGAHADKGTGPFVGQAQGHRGGLGPPQTPWTPPMLGAQRRAAEPSLPLCLGTAREGQRSSVLSAP